MLCLPRCSGQTRCAVAGHCTHDELVVRGVPVSRGFQDSSVTPAAEEAMARQRADVQLPTDIQPSDSVESHRAAGAGQTPATPALLAALFTAAVSVPPRPFHRDCAVAYHEQCIHRR